MGTEHLLAPVRLGPLELANRILMPPLSTRLVAPDGGVGPREVAFLAARARGGAGLVMTGPYLVSAELEPPAGMHRVDSDVYLPGLSRLADAVHDGGARLGVQLSPGAGRLGVVRPGAVPVSASAVPSRDPAVTCRALTSAEVELLVHRFGEAAARVAAAGADLVDVHAHAGFLVDQFLSAAWNHRDDAWGGSVERRAAFAVALVRAAKQAAPGLAVSVRLAVEHGFPGGRELAESTRVAHLLAEAGADLLLAEDGGPWSPGRMAPVHYLGTGTHLRTASALAAAVPVPVAVAGAMTPDLAERALAAGQVALVGMGRALVADPDLPARLAAGRPDRVRPCVRCNLCLDAVRAGDPVRCAVNPAAGTEAVRHAPAATRARHVVVVGGGPAGLEAARTAALRGHVVDLYEAGPVLGGVLARASSPTFKPEMAALVRWYRTELAELGVTVHLERPVRPGSRVLAAADAVVVATGGRPRRPEGTGGLDGAHVHDVLDVAAVPAGAAVVVVGGGASGADAALDLARRGHAVVLVEAGDEVATSLGSARGSLLAALAERDVRVLTATVVTEVRSDGVHVDGPDGRQVLPAGAVVLALGVRPDRELVVDAALEDPRVHVVGDCAEPGTLADAIGSGFRAALAI